MDKDNKRELLKQKLKAKIDQKRVEEGRRPIINNSQKLTTNEEILNNVVAMIHDCELPYIKRLNIRQKFDVLEKKYTKLRKQYIPIFRSVLNGELTMENIAMLEMMLKCRDSSSVSYDQMNNFLAERYKLDTDEESKNDKIIPLKKFVDSFLEVLKSYSCFYY